ncbi:hypothetical protein AAK706_05620 [Erysipelotrichaceae bacterium 66-17]|nr:hypothetical protein EROP_12330 [Erysipelotrichaceae bacterium OPF54]
MKVKIKTKSFVENIEIDGKAVVNSLIATYVWVQMGFSTGDSEVRSQMLA